jgi:hypothetical protein
MELLTPQDIETLREIANWDDHENTSETFLNSGLRNSEKLGPL